MVGFSFVMRLDFVADGLDKLTASQLADRDAGLNFVSPNVQSVFKVRHVPYSYMPDQL